MFSGEEFRTFWIRSYIENGQQTIQVSRIHKQKHTFPLSKAKTPLNNFFKVGRYLNWVISQTTFPTFKLDSLVPIRAACFLSGNSAATIKTFGKLKSKPCKHLDIG